jgi:hypothetical protein
MNAEALSTFHTSPQARFFGDLSLCITKYSRGAKLKTGPALLCSIFTRD